MHLPTVSKNKTISDRSYGIQVGYIVMLIAKSKSEDDLNVNRRSNSGSWKGRFPQNNDRLLKKWYLQSSLGWHGPKLLEICTFWCQAICSLCQRPKPVIPLIKAGTLELKGWWRTVGIENSRQNHRGKKNIPFVGESSFFPIEMAESIPIPVTLPHSVVSWVPNMCKSPTKPWFLRCFWGCSILEGTNPSNVHVFLPDQFAVEFSPETPQCQASSVSYIFRILASTWMGHCFFGPHSAHLFILISSGISTWSCLREDLLEPSAIKNQPYSRWWTYWKCWLSIASIKSQLRPEIPM